MSLHPKSHLHIGVLSVLALLTLVSYQNCGQGFASSSSGSLASLSSSSGAGSVAPGTTSAPGPGSVTTISKTIGDASTVKTLTWDLASEVSTGYAATGVSVSVRVTKFSPVDGSGDVYYVSAPMIVTGSKAMQVRAINVVVNGVKDDGATTFQGISIVVPAAQTLQLSKATLLHPVASKVAAASDTLALEYDLLWPDGVPLPAATPAPVLVSGVTLYNTNCANCHGALGVSSKRSRTYDQIQSSFTSVSQMNYLIGTFSAAEVQAIADALK